MWSQGYLTFFSHLTSLAFVFLLCEFSRFGSDDLQNFAWFEVCRQEGKCIPIPPTVETNQKGVETTRRLVLRGKNPVDFTFWSRVLPVKDWVQFDGLEDEVFPFQKSAPAVSLPLMMKRNG